MTAAAPPGPARARLLLAVGLVFLPVVLVAVSTWHAEAYLVFLALPPTLGGLLLSPAAAWAGAGLTAVGLALGTTLSSSPPAGVCAIAVACAAVAWGARRGAVLLGTTAVTPMALALVSPPALAPLEIAAADPVTARRVLVAAGLVLLGGVWTAAVTTVLLRDLRRPARQPETASAARWYGIVLCPLMAVGTYAAMRWFPGTHAWWVLLTVLVVLHPRFEQIRSHAIGRTLGTVAGAAAAALLVAVVPDERVLVLLGVLCGLAAAVANLTRPYAQYAALLTLTVILLTGGTGTGAAIATALERVALTLLGAGLVLAVVVPGRLLLARQATATGDAGNAVDDPPPPGVSAA